MPPVVLVEDLMQHQRYRERHLVFQVSVEKFDHSVSNLDCIDNGVSILDGTKPIEKRVRLESWDCPNTIVGNASLFQRTLKAYDLVPRHVIFCSAKSEDWTHADRIVDELVGRERLLVLADARVSVVFYAFLECDQVCVGISVPFLVVAVAEFVRSGAADYGVRPILLLPIRPTRRGTLVNANKNRMATAS